MWLSRWVGSRDWTPPSPGKSRLTFDPRLGVRGAADSSLAWGISQQGFCAVVLETCLVTLLV